MHGQYSTVTAFKMTNFILRNDEIKAAMITAVAMLPVGGDVPMEVVIREYKAKRSGQSNAMYWEWLTVMAKYFSKKDVFTKDDMHDLMRHQFLGYETKTIGKTNIGPQLKTTTVLNVKQMNMYMLQIDLWSAEHGCYLPRPEDSDYARYREAAQ